MPLRVKRVTTAAAPELSVSTGISIDATWSCHPDDHGSRPVAGSHASLMANRLIATIAIQNSGIASAMPDKRRDGAVHRASPIDRRRRSKRQPDQQCNEQGRQRQFQRVGEAISDVGADLPVVEQSTAEIAVQNAVQPAQILLIQRPIETELRADAFDRLRRGVLAGDGFGRAARNDLHHRKDQNAAEQGGRQQQEQASKDQA